MSRFGSNGEVKTPVERCLSPRPVELSGDERGESAQSLLAFTGEEKMVEQAGDGGILVPADSATSDAGAST